MQIYKPVLAVIQAKRVALGVELSELDVMEQGIMKLSGLQPIQLADTPKNTAALDQPKGTLKELSVREAALKVLALANGPVRTGELAQILKAGGIRSKGKNFPNQVAGVLSGMITKKETVRTKNGFVLAAHGRAVWEETQAALAKIEVA